MKTFKLYKHSDNKLEAVKIGFSWPAFFFFPFWMLLKRLWLMAIVSIVTQIIIDISFDEMKNMSLHGQDDSALAGIYCLSAICNVTLWLAASFRGNTWREANLVRRGYQYVGVVTAASADDARSRAGFAAGLSSEA